MDGRCSDADTGSNLTSFRAVEEEEAVSGDAAGAVVDDKVFVAVGKEVKASQSTLVWALQNAGSKKVQVEKEYIEMASIESGIVELIHKLRIGLLVMGAAADNKYSRKMIEPKSKKAVYVRRHAPPTCHIWFACKGRLIYTREGTKSSRTSEQAVIEQRLVCLDTDGVEVARSSSASHCNLSAFSTLWSRSVTGQSSFDELDQSSTMSIRLSFGGLSPRSETAGSSPFSSMRTQDRDPRLQLSALPPTNDGIHGPSLSDVLATSSMNDPPL